MQPVARLGVGTVADEIGHVRLDEAAPSNDRGRVFSRGVRRP